MAAEVLSARGLRVDVYDAMPSAGRKLLVAGKGGLNLTRAEPFEEFLTHYGDRQAVVREWLCAFGPGEVQQWAESLGIETFVGTSKRVFPKEMKAAPLLRAWMRRLRQAGVVFHFRHRWTGWDETGALQFDTSDGRVSVKAGATVLALGGASWPVTGSTGEWVKILAAKGIPLAPLRPANCGFEVNWSEHFRERFAGAPFKTVVASFTDSRGRSFRQRGEFVITETGVEGNLIYAVSALLRDEIEAAGQALLLLDLLPDFSLEQVRQKLDRPRGSRSLSSHLEKTVGVRGVKAGLLQEVLHSTDTDVSSATDSDVFAEHPRRAAEGTRRRAAAVADAASLLKDLPVRLIATRPIEEAISSAGGIKLEALDERLMLKALPGVFCAGEMLDWEAPTGGYLLTACLASGQVAGGGAAEWINTLKGSRLYDRK
jgi:uncharacterized flavoprotein (TIGR03862 family)